MEREVSDEIKMINGKSLPGGWSSYQMEHNGEVIGSVYCGFPELKPEAEAAGYSMTQEKTGNVNQVRIYYNVPEIETISI